MSTQEYSTIAECPIKCVTVGYSHKVWEGWLGWEEMSQSDIVS